jgi:hypothetical protein
VNFFKIAPDAEALGLSMFDFRWEPRRSASEGARNESSPWLEWRATTSFRRKSTFLDQPFAEIDAVIIVDVEQCDSRAAHWRATEEVSALPAEMPRPFHLWRRGLNRGVSLRVSGARPVRSDTLNELQ